ncbi:ABC transporter permease [Amaricoccus solimangrovi]|uniref:ABC transporter permease n=1 Tax=Amaricoccus solimangrovi TaxID=2589815 RepID=A0A501WLD6_9RHOB|nr:ABC transporter permease [Amaricoccus solimangrovi]TPE47861.1 ABC transporter permease [Amaricoccus solimangrovi]
MRLLLALAVAHIRGRARQTLVAGLGVALGVGFSIAMAALMQGSQDDFVRQLVDTMPHVEITDETRAPAPQPAEAAYDVVAFSNLRIVDDRRGIANPTAARARLEAWVPGTVAPALVTQGVARYAGRDAGVTVTGVEPEIEERASSVAGDFVQGGFRSLDAGGDNVVIGDGLAGKLGATLGDTVDIVSPSGLSRGFRVVGLFHTGARARDEGEVYMALRTARILAERPNVINRIRLRLEDPDAAPAIAARAEAGLGYKAVSWQEANEAILEALVIRNFIMYTVVAAILLVAGFGIFNIVSTITHEKARDIAILKSLGFAETDMRRLFLIEGLAIGGAGAVLGWAIGYGLCLALGSVRFEVPELGDATRLPLAWSPWHYAISSALALGAAGIAGYLPARRAARLNPVDIIRGAT